MKLSARDKVIAALLPALAAIGGYNWLYARGMSQQINALNAKIAQTEAPAPSALAEKRKIVDRLNSAIATEQARAKLRQPHASLPSPDNRSRAQSLRTMTRQFADSGLVLVKTSRVDAAKPQSDSDVEWLAQKQSLPAPEYWRVELVGSYAQMIDALKGLSSSADFVVPLTVEMDGLGKTSKDGEGLQKWALVVWL